MKLLAPLLLPLALLALPAAAEARLSREEQRMVRTVGQETDRSIALLERLVNQNSGTLNLAGVEAVGRMLRPEFEALGFEVRWVPMAEAGRAGHLIATHRGNGRGRRILLIGHLDTVFEAASPFQRFERQGNRATGPGVGDDKGGDVVIVAALRAMQAAGTLRDADVMVVLTGDEERPGAPMAVARRDLLEAGRWADVALEFENLATDEGREYGTVARRGSFSWTLRTTGRTGHSSGVFGPGLGYGAIYEMARILDSFRRELPEENLTFNVGVIGGGTPAAIDAQNLTVTASGKTNIVAEAAIARGDLRALTPEQEARVRARMEAIVALHLPQTGAGSCSRKAIRRCRRRQATGRCSPRSTRSTATPACPRWRSCRRRSAAPPIRASSPPMPTCSAASARRAAARTRRANISSSTASPAPPSAPPS
jgi:glutamate carboxypeptidase